MDQTENRHIEEEEILSMRRAVLNLIEDLAAEKEEVEKKIIERTEQLFIAKARADTLIESLTTGLIEYDDNFTLLRINRAAERMLGVQRETVVNKEILPRDINKSGWKSLVEVSYPILSKNQRKILPPILGPNIIANEMLITYPLNLDIQVITAPIILENGETSGFIKVIRDITREQMLARSKNEFIAIATHQLRTPLTVIKWALSNIFGRERSVLSAEGLLDLSNAIDTNERMITLVDDLLDVARIEEGKFGYVFVEGNLTHIIESIIQEYKSLSQEKNITVNLDIPSAAIPLIYFDKAKITLAFNALIDNAFHYVLNGGNISVSMKQEEKWIIVEIQDNGIGIPKDQIKRLFTKFFRATNAINLTPNGSGLGLYIARNIIERHGGKIEVQSVEDVGTTFRIKIPALKEMIPEVEESIF